MKTHPSPSFRRRCITRGKNLGLPLAILAMVFLCGVARAQQTFIAYAVPAGVPSNQGGLANVAVGMDFEVANEIIVTRLGIFDASSDGITPGVTLVARLWDRGQDPPVEIASMSFTSDDAGELIGGSRFRPLDAPLHLPNGFQGTITGDGWADTDSIVNSFGTAANVVWTTHDGNASLAFVGNSRYGVPPGSFPGTVDTGPAARYAAGTFEYQSTPPILPGKPILTAKGGDGQILLSWPPVIFPAVATTYRVSRADSPLGPFVPLATVPAGPTPVTYTDTGLVNGVPYSYIVEGIAPVDRVGPASDVKTAAGYALDSNHHIAYATPASLTGNQSLPNAVGLEFNVQNPILVTRLGIFDSKSDGLSGEINARIYDRDTQQAVALLVFTAAEPGVLIEGMRFKDLDQPLRLEAGFRGLIEADGFVNPDPIFNSGGNPANVVWALNDANGSLLFVGSGRYGAASLPSEYPDTADGGPVAPYAAGTFEFESLPPEFAGVPQVRVITPFEDQVVTLTWPAITKPLAAVKYEIERGDTVDGPFSALAETTAPNFRDSTVQNGTEYFYKVRAVPATGNSAESAVVSAIPNPRGGGVAYTIPAGWVGNQALPNYSVGMDFDVAHPIQVTQLGVFDDASDGISMRVAAVLFDRTSRRALATIEFTPEIQGDLIDGSRFQPLPEPLILDAGFKGSIVMWFSNGSTERNYNTHGNPAAVANLQLFGGGSIVFVGSSRYGAATSPETFPPTADGGPANRYGAGTFAFEPVVVDHPTVVAYAVPASTVGNQDVTGAAIGMDFDVRNEIVVTRLGVFDDGSDGIKQIMTVRLWEFVTNNPVPVQIGIVEFRPGREGQLIGGSRFNLLPEPLRLRRGFQGSISVDYTGALERLRNSFGTPANVTWTLNTGNGSLAFVGGGRYGGAGGFPATADGGPAARYAAGTFEFQTTPPATPGIPVVTVRKPSENGAVTLSWLQITAPLPAVKYEVLRRSGIDDFVKIGETTELTYRDTTVQNGTTYSYRVRGVAAGGETGDASNIVTATPNPIQGGIAYVVPDAFLGNQPLNNGAVGMDFDLVAPIKVTQLGVFDDGSDGITMTLTAVLYDRVSRGILAQQEFTVDNQGDLIGGSRFLPLTEPLDLAAGFQGSMVIWYSNDATERLFNTFGGNAEAAGLRVFDGGSILFVGGGRYGATGTFPGTVDGGPVNRYAGGTFAFEPGPMRPTIRFVRAGDKLTLTWDGGGTLERVNTLGALWQPVVGAVSGIEITLTGSAGFFRVRQ